MCHDIIGSTFSFLVVHKMMKYGIWEDESPLSSRGSCFSRKKKNTLSGEKQCSSKRYDKGQRGVLWGDGRELTRQKGLESFEGEVELKLELEGCLAVSSSGREEEGHSNHGAMCKGQDTHPIGEKDEYSVSRSRPESAGSSMHAKGFWFYSGKSRDQACVWEWYLPAVCHQHEDNCWEAGRHCWEWPMWGKEGRNRKPWALLVFRHFISIGSHSYSQRQEGNIIPIL